jgi:hypothetical protein
MLGDDAKQPVNREIPEAGRHDDGIEHLGHEYKESDACNKHRAQDSKQQVS